MNCNNTKIYLREWKIAKTTLNVQTLSNNVVLDYLQNKKILLLQAKKNLKMIICLKFKNNFNLAQMNF